MNFISSVYNKVTESLNLSSNFTVTEVQRNSFTQSELVYGNRLLTLYKFLKDNNFKYSLILTVSGSTPKYLRLFLTDNETEATRLYDLFVAHLLPIATVVNAVTLNINKVQEICNTIRKGPKGGVVHTCVQLGLIKALQSKHPDIENQVDVLDDTNSSALHVACREPMVSDEFVSHLLALGADVTLRDSHGETAYTLAARYSPSKLKILTAKQSEGINYLTIFGETALHIACSENRPECVEILLQAKADPLISESYKSPIHCAVKANSVKCVELLANHNPELLTIRDAKFGGTALHWAKSKEMIMCLLKYGAEIDALSNSRDTSLHIMLKSDRRSCVIALLTMGADVSIPNHDGETPLHIAIPTDDLAMVRSLLVHGADVNMFDRNGVSPRHLTALCRKKNSDQILFTLHMVGAERCEAGQSGCNDGCRHDGSYNGKAILNVDNEAEGVEDICDELLIGSTIASSLSDINKSADTDGHYVLCLDGGGMRGLVLAVILMQLEKLLRAPIRDSFDWIAGTSTGGILALGLAYGRDARYCLGLYLRLKDQVFCGSKPYNVEPFEEILKKEFGAETLMTCLEKPKIIVTAVLADRHPPDLYLFKNYTNPIDTMIPPESRRHPGCSPAPKPEEVKIWQAARCSGAAPTYFRAALDRFLDGGLMSNNPTMDTLTEIHEYNSSLRAMNQHHLVKPIKCVVSLGTGRMPRVKVTDIDVYRPGGIMEAYKVVQGAQSLIKLLVEQASQSEGQPSDRARAWCSMAGTPYFRLSPQFTEEVLLDETDDDKLHFMCWETMAYLHRNREKLEKIATIIKSRDPFKKRPSFTNLVRS